MEVIHKIEVCAKCPSNDTEAKELIQSLSHTITVTLHSSNSGCIPQIRSIIFEDFEKLDNGNRYALILSKEKLSYPTSNIRSVGLDWSSNNCNSIGGHFGVHLNEDDVNYDHILTDVRYSDRSLPVPPGCYSVCSFVSNGVSNADIYVTVHTKIV